MTEADMLELEKRIRFLEAMQAHTTRLIISFAKAADEARRSIGAEFNRANKGNP